MSTLPQEKSYSSLSAGFDKLEEDAKKLEQDQLILYNKSRRVREIYKIYINAKQYDKCKEILHELAVHDQELFRYMLQSSEFVICPYDKLPLVIPEAVLKFKSIKLLKFNDVSNFISFIEESDIPKNILFNELLSKNIEMINITIERGHYYGITDNNILIKFLLKYKDYVKILALDTIFMNNLKIFMTTIKPSWFNTRSNTVLHKICKELFEYLDDIRMKKEKDL